jgi:hypothetical protein
LERACKLQSLNMYILRTEEFAKQQAEEASTRLSPSGILPYLVVFNGFF